VSPGKSDFATILAQPTAAFLVGEMWILSWNASVQRASKYGRGISDRDRMRFRADVIDYCQSAILGAYLSPVTVDDHLSNIQALRDHVRNHAIGRRLERPYSIGNAQKLLNLQLKYLWCAGLISKPPHCPVDRIVLGHTHLRNKLAWTRIDSIGEYLRAIAAIREVARGMDLADWELANFDRRA